MQGAFRIFGARFSIPEQQQRDPGHHILAVLEIQPVFLQGGGDIDALTLHAGVHFIRMSAGRIIQNGAALADGAGFGGEDF